MSDTTGFEILTKGDERWHDAEQDQAVAIFCTEDTQDGFWPDIVVSLQKLGDTIGWAGQMDVRFIDPPEVRAFAQGLLMDLDWRNISMSSLLAYLMEKGLHEVRPDPE